MRSGYIGLRARQLPEKREYASLRHTRKMRLKMPASRRHLQMDQDFFRQLVKMRNVGHIYLPAHVINLDAEKETGRDVEGDEEQPEVRVAVEDADDADEDDERQRGEGHVGVGVDVRVPRLVDLEQDEDGDGVHEGRVEL